MTKESYAELLKDPRWQRRRLEMLSAAGWMCRSCFGENKTLHVHHRVYRKGAMPWEYTDAELIVLCERCHVWIHAIMKNLERILATAGPHEIGRIYGYARARLAISGDEPAVVTPKSTSEILGAEDGLRNPWFDVNLEFELDENGNLDLKPAIDGMSKAEERAIIAALARV